MPPKLDRCVEQVMKEQGVSKERAFAICTATLDNGFAYVGLKDNAVSFTTHIDERTGFLHVDAVIARTGVQTYLPSEVGDEGSELVGVFRPLEEVTQDASVKSFTNVPITDNHPTEMVTIDNFSKYAKGSISSIVVVQLDNGETALKTQIVITDKSLIESIKNGKKELSVGYENILVQKDGTHKGEGYKYIQTDIRANHVAVVDAGRCGGMCKLMIDKSSMSNNLTKDEGETVMKITINGVEFDVVEEVAAEIDKLKAALEAKSEDEGSEEEKEAMDKLQATVDSLTIDKGNLTKKLTNAESLVDAGVTAKLNILATAKDVGAKCQTSDSVLAIKQAIVTTFGMDIADKSETYLDAAIDMKKQDMADTKKRSDDAKQSYNKIGQEYKTKDSLDPEKIGNQEMGGK